MRFLTSRTFRDRGQRAGEPGKDLAYAMRHDEERGGRAWEDPCLRRWPYDKAVRFTHGANCPDLCSFDVFAKDGIIVWKSQKTDNLTPYPNARLRAAWWLPDPFDRGARSPLRVWYSSIRGKLLHLWREVKNSRDADPVAAREASQNLTRRDMLIRSPVAVREASQSGPGSRRASQRAHGKGGFARFSGENGMKAGPSGEPSRAAVRA